MVAVSLPSGPKIDGVESGEREEEVVRFLPEVFWFFDKECFFFLWDDEVAEKGFK